MTYQKRAANLNADIRAAFKGLKLKSFEQLDAEIERDRAEVRAAMIETGWATRGTK